MSLEGKLVSQRGRAVYKIITHSYTGLCELQSQVNGQLISADIHKLGEPEALKLGWYLVEDVVQEPQYEIY
jgi:hypothetical protein